MAAGLVRRGRMILLLADRHSPSQVAQTVGVQRAVVRQWARRFLAQCLAGVGDAPGRGAKGGFPPEVAISRVGLPCERLDIPGRSLSQWDYHELAGPLIAEAIVEDILPRPCDGFWRTISCSPSAIICGSIPSPPGCRIVCYGLCTHRSLYASTPR